MDMVPSLSPQSPAQAKRDEETAKEAEESHTRGVRDREARARMAKECLRRAQVAQQSKSRVDGLEARETEFKAFLDRVAQGNFGVGDVPWGSDASLYAMAAARLGNASLAASMMSSCSFTLIISIACAG